MTYFGLTGHFMKDTFKHQSKLQTPLRDIIPLPSLFLNRWVTQGNSVTCPKFHSESTLDNSIPLLTSLGHVFHINHLAIILEIFSELFVFLILQYCVSLEFKRLFFYSTPKSQVCAPGPGSLLDSLSQAGIP